MRARYHGSRDIKMVDTKKVATNISNIVTFSTLGDIQFTGGYS